MRVGIIAEGRGDLAVLTNLLKGVLELDQADITYLRPELSLDETDLYELRPEQRGTFLLVREECRNTAQLEAFLQTIDEPRLLVVHLDTAEAHRPEYGIDVPPRDDLEAYVAALRQRVIALIDGWLEQRFRGRVRYAVAIEEIDAWVLVLYEEQDRDTSIFRTPKARLQAVLNRNRKDVKQLSQRKTFDRYLELSRDFRKPKRLRASMGRNLSLRLFCESLGSGKDRS
jgi:hypothetical protein